MSTPHIRDWSTIPSAEFAGAGGRLITERDAPPLREAGRGLFSLFGRTQQPTYDNGIFPPAFFRPAPNFQPGTLQWFAPVLIQSRSGRLSEGFPAIFPAQELMSHDVAPADWQTFLQHIDAMIRSGVVNDPAGYGPAAQVLVSQWGGAFFGPRRIRVTLRPELQVGHHHGSRVDKWDARSVSSASSTSTSSMSSSSSDDSHKHQKRKSGGGKQHCAPHGGWVSPHAAAASASSWRVQRKLEREQNKAERKARRAERKAERKARRTERKERRRERKIARQESKAMRKGKFIPSRPGAGRWELLVECI